MKQSEAIPGTYVTWRPALVTAVPRYGCIMSEVDSRGRVEVVASNGRFPVDVERLEPAPDCPDPIMADQISTYGTGFLKRPLERCPFCGLSRDAGFGDHGCEGCGT